MADTPVAVNIFDELRKRINKQQGMLPAEKRAMYWFRNYATQLSKWQRTHAKTTFDQLQLEKFSKQIVTPAGAFPGALYFFMYEAKWDEELPYWDQFPFTLVLSKEKDRFLGLNFHYLDYYQRAKFFDLLYPFREGRTATPTYRDLRMRLRVTYDILAASRRYKAFRPCIKSYLIEQVQTPLMKVSAHEWDIALFLPVESFVKKSKSFVWKESVSKYHL